MNLPTARRGGRCCRSAASAAIQTGGRRCCPAKYMEIPERAGKWG